MNKSGTFSLILLAGLCAVFVTVPATGADDRQALVRPPGAAGAQPVSAMDILDRIERFRTLSADSTGLLLAGLESADDPLACLETGLLLIYGPAQHRDLRQGSSKLTPLLGSVGSELTPDAHRVLRLVVEHAGQVLALDSHLKVQADALEQMKENYRVLQEKLHALRQIDGTLESERESQNSGDHNRSQHR